MKTRAQIAEPILRTVAQSLASAAGIDPDALDAERIAWTIETRRRRLQLLDPDAYLEYLNSSSDELDHLIDALVIQETRFFRDQAVFEQIRVWANSTPASGRPSLRILSAPCSTGQEAYSVGAVLRLAGIPLARFTIDAFDISRAAISTARRAIYPARALEHVPEELRRVTGELKRSVAYPR